MEKKTALLVGFVVLVVALGGWFALSTPTAEEAAAVKTEKTMKKELKDSAKTMRGMADAFDAK